MAAASSGQNRSKDLADQKSDNILKLLIIGNSSVGKTSFLLRYSEDSFNSGFVSTVGIDFKVQTVFRNNKQFKLQIWDTAGQERYRTITTAYYRGAKGFILMYDVTNEESFKAVVDWAGQVTIYACEDTQVVLVGNKCDMYDERTVTYDQGKKLSEQLGFPFFETSAKYNINVNATFDKLVDVILSNLTSTDPFELDQKFPNKPPGGGCSC